MLKGLISDNIILVIPNNIKKSVLLELSKVKTIYNVKIMSLNELINSFTFNYDEKSIYYLMRQYNINYDIAIMYLNNIKYIDVNYKDKKLSDLVKIKKDLHDNDLLIYDKNINNLLKNKEIIIFGYDYISKYDLKIIDKIKTVTTVKIIKKEYRNYDHNVYEFQTIEDEVYFIASKILDLINNKVKVQNIKLAGVTSEYESEILRVFDLFNIPINMNINKGIISSLIACDFLDYLKENNVNESLNYIKNKYENKNEKNNDIINKIINILNKYIFVDNKKILINILRYEFSMTNIDKVKYKNAISIIDLKNNIIDDDDYIFLLGFNMGNVPVINKDEDYLSDKIKRVLGIEDSNEKNSIEKKIITNIIKDIKNLIITYKLKTNFDSYMPSLLIEELNLNVIKNIDKKYKYSNIYNSITLGKKLDNFIAYGKKDNTIDLLFNNKYGDNYLKYNNKFKGIDKLKFQNSLSGKLLLSYSSIDNYNRCNFRYYLNNILRITEFEENFAQNIGTIFHDILSKAFKEGFDFDTEFNDLVKDKIFNNKEKFFIKKLKEELKFVIDVINKQNSFNSLDKALYENKVYVNKEGNIALTFMGIIDKILYKEENNKTYLVIIDYKTGYPHTNLNNTIYGIDMQLPVYLYLTKNGLFKNAEVIGFYLQKILNNEFIKDNNKTYLKQKQDNLKLQGYTIDNEKLIEKFDFTYKDSEVIKSLKQGNNGFYSYSKIITKDQIDKLTTIVSNNIDNAFNDILDVKFDINPKRIGKELKGCEYCKYKDICYMKEEDIINLDEYKNLEFLEKIK